MKAEIEKDAQLSQQVTVESAGIAAQIGDRASENAIEAVAQEWGIDISSHNARPLDKEMVFRSDLILTMTRRQKEVVASLFPDSKSRVFTLKEYISENETDKSIEEYNFALDIIDPYGGTLPAYRQCARDIKQAVDKLVSKLKKL